MLFRFKDIFFYFSPNNFFLMAAKKPPTANAITFQNFRIIAKKPTLAKTFPAINPPIVHSATLSIEESKLLYFKSSLNSKFLKHWGCFFSLQKVH